MKGLQWPASRNELLQILIRKKWTSSMFETFCNALRDNASSTNCMSSSNQVLADKLSQAAQVGRRKTGSEYNGGKFIVARIYHAIKQHFAIISSS